MTPDGDIDDIPSGMVRLAGGAFLMGSDRFYPEEAPQRPARLAPFLIDRCPVTNAEFAAFVAATGHVTLAERPADPALYPDAAPAQLAPASAVFTPPLIRVPLNDPRHWWRLVPGACWRHPEGPRSDLEGRADHPVIHVALVDALAYAAWAGKDLPTEAEWEFAAKGGLAGAEYAWGDTLTPGGRHLANTWQGEFPLQNLAEDGYRGTSPVGAFPPNGFGLHDMIGNVWEWTRDDWSLPGTGAPKSPCCRGPAATPANSAAAKVIKGGSHLCAPNYCQRYRPAARHMQDLATTTSHLGFRCVRRF